MNQYINDECFVCLCKGTPYCCMLYNNSTENDYGLESSHSRPRKGHVSSSKRPTFKCSPSDFSEITKQRFVQWPDNRIPVCITKLNRNLRVKVSVSKNGPTSEERHFFSHSYFVMIPRSPIFLWSSRFFFVTKAHSFDFRELKQELPMFHNRFCPTIAFDLLTFRY